MALDTKAFDNYAAEYDAALELGISVSGENKDYFARRRIEWLVRCLARLSEERPERILDFGCGTGSATSFFAELVAGASILGIDVSSKALEVAKQLHTKDQTAFLLFDQYTPNAEMDLVYCNGVFHHIPLGDRADAIRYIYRSLRPGGLFAFWENNPWNPGTRYVMSRIPFDRDAKTLAPPAARTLLRANGFEILDTDFLFIFPRMLRLFRCFEPGLSHLPLGAQYQVLCRRPEI